MKITRGNFFAGVAVVIGLSAGGAYMTKRAIEFSAYRQQVLTMMERDHLCGALIKHKDGSSSYNCGVYLVDYTPSGAATWYEVAGISNDGVPFFISLEPGTGKTGTYLNRRLPQSCLSGAHCDVVRKDDPSWFYMQELVSDGLADKQHRN